MLLDTINRKLAEQYERETRARTVLRLVPTPKITEKARMPRDPAMLPRPARAIPARAMTVLPPKVPHDLQDDPDVHLPAPAPLPVIEVAPAEPELPEPEKPETDVKASKGTVKPGCITVGLPLPKDMHAVFKARALANGTSIKREVLLSLGRDLG